MEDIIISGPLKPNGQNQPTRQGEIVDNIAEVGSVPNPYVGMNIYVKEENATYKVLALADKTIGGVTVPNARVSTTEKVPDQRDVEELVLRLQGESEESNAFTDPFKNLGNFSTMVGLKEALDALYITSVTDAVAKAGYYRATIGVRLYNIVLQPTSNALAPCCQIISGMLSVADGVINLSYDDKYGVAVRYFVKQSDNSVSWGEWEILSSIEKNKEIENAIADETKRAQAEEQAIRQLITDLIGESPEALDSIHEISSWILNDESGAAAMVKQINENAAAIAYEAQRAQTAEALVDAQDSFIPVGETNEDVIGFHTLFKNVKVECESATFLVDTSSIALSLLRKGFTEGYAEIRWSALIDGVRKYIFGYEVLIELSGVNTTGYTHIEQENPSYGMKISYDVDFSSALFPKSTFVYGSLTAEPTMLLSRDCIGFAQEPVFKKSYYEEFTKNKGYYIKAQVGSVVPTTPTANSPYTYAEIDVREGEVFVAACARSAHVLGWAVLDADRNILSHSGYATGNDDMVLSNVKIAMPVGAKRLLVNLLVPYNTLTPYLAQVIDLYSDIPELNSRLSVLEGTSSNISGTIETVSVLENTIDSFTRKDYSNAFVKGGYIKIQDGKVAPTEAVKYADASYIKVEACEGLRFTGKGYATGSVLAWAATDALGNILQHSGYSEEWGGVKEFDIVMPKYTKYFIVNNFSKTNAANLEQIIEPRTDISLLYNVTSTAHPLYGKKVLCLGDSITEFRNSSGDGLRYSDHFARITGAVVYNGGIGGAHMEQRAKLTLEPSNANIARAALDLPALVDAIVTGDWSYQDVAAEYLKNNAGDDNTTILAELKNVDVANIDVVTIFIGTNDKDNPESRLGVVGDVNPVQNSLGGFGHTIEVLLTANPNLRIYYFCPMPRYFENPTDKEWDDSLWCDNYIGGSGTGVAFTEIVEKMIDNARYWHIPVCDMYRTLGVNRFNIFTHAPDGTHPIKSLKMIANKIASFIVANNNLS